MTRNEILENLCYYDERSPIGVRPHRINRVTGEYEVIYSESKDKDCTCRNCTSGKTKMAVAMLEMICCGNCAKRINGEPEDDECKWWSHGRRIPDGKWECWELGK